MPEARGVRAVDLMRGMLATPLVAASLRIAGLRRTRSWLAAWPRIDGSTPPPDDAPARVHAVARAVGIAAGPAPVRAGCLRRALVAWWLLRREGIAVAIRIGVRRERDRLLAHAWIEHRGLPVGEAPDVASRFAMLEADFAR